MSDRNYLLSVVMLGILALAQAIDYYTGGTAGDTTAPSYITARAGATIGVPVLTRGAPAPASLSSVGAGSCRYVIVYSLNCGASRAMARRWKDQLAAEGPSAQLSPPGWRVIWARIEPPPTPDDSDLVNLPVTLVSSAALGSLEQEFHIRAFPVHILLDRDGRIVSAGGGAEAPPYESFRKDCRLGNAR